MFEQDVLLRELEEIHDGYRIDVKQFVDFMRTKNLSLNKALKEYSFWLEEDHDGKHYSPATFNRKISAAKNRIRYAFKHGSFANSLRSKYQLEDILSEVKLKRVESLPLPIEKTVTIDEVKKLVRETKDRTIGIMVKFLVGTGVRISEMLAITLIDLRPGSENIVDVRVMGKRGKERCIHVKADFVKKIHEHFKGSEFLFEHDGRMFNRVSVTNRIKHESLRILGREVSAQQLRYTWAREQIRRGKSVRAVAVALGYADPGQAAKLYTEDSLIPQESFLDVEVSEQDAKAQ